MTFSPPYGDSTSMMNVKNMEVGLSPPYGGDMNFRILPHLLDLFSPPYGDCTLNISQNTAKLKSRMARKYSHY